MVTKITKEQRQGRKQKKRIIITVVIIVAYMCGTICVLNNFDTVKMMDDYAVTVKKPLEEPVFVKNLVSYGDMDVEIEYITDNEFKLTPVDVRIPNMPDELYLDFYDEYVEKYQGYELHYLNFGIGCDSLSESGGLAESFTFNEIVVEWDDGSETKADIGIINMTSTNEAYTFDHMGSELLESSEKKAIAKESFHANDNLSITKIEIPYIEKLPGLVSEMKLNGRDVSEITEKNPFVVEKGKDYMLRYNIDSTTTVGFGKIFLECLITGTNTEGKQITNTFVVQDLGKVLPEWVYEQIENAEQ